MPAPTTINEFVELVQKSGVLEDKKLDAYMEKLRAAMALPGDPSRLAGLDPGKLAGLLVRDGLLTNFQAEQFLIGKWRRFTIGKYKVLERLGSGGMGAVYLCEHRLMRRRVAVKVLPTAKAEDSSSLERFYREARAVAALDHPNIVRAYDIDQDDKLHFLVMEYVDGASLQEMVKRGGPLDVTRACHYMRQAAYGLQHAHETAGLVHRDIKPGNILVDRTGTVKILDMGLARFFHDEDDILTKKYDENVLGTADYLAPEQALDSHSVDIRADVYSLGGTFYFCLTGRTPFSEGTVAQKLIWHQTRQPKPLKQVRSDIPDGVAAVIDRMMTKDPAQRYQTPAEVAAALEPFTETPIGPPPEVEMPRLSPAATGSPPSIDGSPKTPPPPPSSGSSSGGKAWTVAVAPAKASPSPAVRPASTPEVPVAPAASTAPTVSANTATRPIPTLAATPPRPVPPAPAPAVRPAKNGQAAAALGSDLATASAPTIPNTRPASAADVEEESLAWEKLASDTDPAAQADTSPRSSRKAAARSGKRQSLRVGRRFPLWMVFTGAAVLMVLASGAVWWSLSGSPTPTKPTTVANVPLIVNSGKPGGAYRSVLDAVRAARPGQRVVIEDETITERCVLNNTGNQKLGHGVTIEAAPGIRVIWKPPASLTLSDRLVMLGNVPGLRLKGITFDGEGKLAELALLTGTNPDLTLEDVAFQGFKDTGIVVANAAGANNRPIAFDKVTITASVGKAKQALLFSVYPNIQPAPNQFFSFRKSVLEGDFQQPIRVNDQEVRSTAFLDTVWKGPQGTPKQILELPKPPPPPTPPKPTTPMPDPPQPKATMPMPATNPAPN